MNKQYADYSLYKKVNGTRLADVGKVTEVTETGYTLTTPLGVEISVGKGSFPGAQVGMCVFYTRKGGRYQVTELAPYAF